jgi:hypothetical protein
MLISDLDHLRDLSETADAVPVGNQYRIALGMLIVALAVVYAPVLITPYATADDYATAGAISQGGISEFKLRLAGGRPLDALLNQISFSVATSIDDFTYLRALGVAGIVLLAGFLARALAAAGWGLFESFFVSIIVFTLPTFQVYAAWAVTAFYPFASLAAGVALWQSEKVISGGYTHSRWRTVANALIAIGLLLTAITVYQPAAMIFWTFAAVSLFKPGAAFRTVFLRFMLYAGICAAALVIGYGIYHLGQSIFGTELLHPLRSRIATDIWGKFLWFIGEPLVNSLNLFLLFPRVWVAVAMAVFLITGLLLYFEGNDLERLGQLAIAMFILPMAYLPNLVVAENWSSYRTVAGLSSVIAVYSFFALHGYLKLRRRFGAVPPAAGLLALPVVLASIVAMYNVRTYFVAPLYRERMWINDQLRKADLANARGVYVLPAEWHHSIAPDVRYDEFGIPFSSRPYALKPAISISFNELRAGKSTVPIEIGSSKDPRQAPPGFVFLDMRKIWSLRFD